MTNAPKVSVIIPAHNCSKYITEAVESVLNQSGQKNEIIVIDDGSKDDTQKVLMPYIKRNLIKYIYQENQGPGAARNRGIRAATGDYICFLDGDDRLLQNSLLEKTMFLDKFPEVGFVFSDFFIHFKENHPPITRLASEGFLDFFKDAISDHNGDSYVFNSNFYYRYITFPIWPIWTGSVMMRKHIIQDVGLFCTNRSIAEDVEYWLRVVRNTKIGFINKPLSIYNKTRSSLTRNPEYYFFGGIDMRLNVLSDELKDEKCPPFIISKLKNKISYEYSEFGRHALRNFDIIKSRMAFLNALKFNHFSFVSYLFILISLLPMFIQKKLRYIKNV